MKSLLAITAFAMAITSSMAFAECALLDGAYVSESVLHGNRGDMIAFSQGYEGSHPDCTGKITMTQTASVPAVNTNILIPDGQFRKTEVPGLSTAWKWEGSHLVRYDREGSQTRKSVEIYLEAENGRAVLTYLAYIFPNKPNTFKSYAIAGPNAPML